jgi:hypothetical protein
VNFDRLRVVAALPADGGWRADLAVDRDTSPPRAVLVARVPPAVAGDALALALLARGLDLCGRIQHAGLRPLLGTGEVDGDLVLVEGWREGETLRAVLDAGGPLTEALVARVGVEVASALHAGHTLPEALGRPLCHGAVSAERVLLAENGEVLLCGLGRPVGENVTPADDLRGLARTLLESLPPTGSEGPGPLEAACHRVLVGEGFPTAVAFAEAVAAAVTPAPTAAVVARLEASLPEGMPAWEARRRALAQALRAEGGSAAEEVAGGASPGPGHTPPPLPPGPVEAAGPPSGAMEPPPPVAAPAAAIAGPEPDQFVEVVRAVPGPGGPLHLGTRPSPFQAWLRHPQTPAAVAAAAGLLGFALGFALGGR